MNNQNFKLIDEQGNEVKYRIKGKEVEVWFANMDLNQEGCIWTGNLDELVFNESLQVVKNE